ncbi:MAG TPA: hypothetical protein VJ852_08030 [Gemmatimonadaceae bacterium]|nr:hypothetical protein [Gemmatimonadaceae bacterium]
MLFRNRQKDPRVMIKAGMVFTLFFFLMNLLPHPTTPFGDGLFDGVQGALLGISATLLMWGTYLNGRQRRSS